MGLQRICMAVVYAAVASLALGALAGCADTAEGSPSEGAVGSGDAIVTVDRGDITGGVAATVNGVEIGENAVTAYVNNLRHSRGLLDDEDWGQWMFDAGYTVDSFRADTIDYFANQELIVQAASSQGIEVAEDEVEQAVSEIRDQLGEEEYAEALESQGADDKMLHDEMRVSLLQRKLMDVVSPVEEVSEDEIVEYLKLSRPSDIDADATSLEGVDEEAVDAARESLEASKQSQAFSAWMLEYKENQDLYVSGMPDGLPYIVDLKPFEDAAFEEAKAAEDAAGAPADNEDVPARPSSEEE